MTINRNDRSWWIRHCLVSICPLALIWAASKAPALELQFPVPTETTASRGENLTSIHLPSGPFAGQHLPTIRVEGALQIQAFRLELSGASTLEMMQALRAQIENAGFDIQFECETLACGGYDFRYGVEILPEPDMHVDLGDFRYLAATRGGSGAKTAEHIGLMVSRAGQTGFVQLTAIGGTDAAVNVINSLPKTTAPDAKSFDPGGLDRLALGTSQVLEDLVFASGSSTLTSGSYASLQDLARWLRANPGQKVFLVGHTDASGSLEGNTKLSKLRAESVRQVLLNDFDIAPEQVQAEGVGFLAPRESNLTAEGRKRNRRVEVMLTPTAIAAP